MIDLEDIINDLLDEGYDEELAPAKLCQDIIIKAVSESRLSKNVTIKGGVVMRELSNNIRRATKDLDMDFIKYSISDESIDLFINQINCLEGISIKRYGNIETLKHQDYHGKRVFVEITDIKGFSMTGKLDIGVHNDLNIEQEEYCFEVAVDEKGVTMIINSKEQIFAEKLYSLLKRSTLSTRYKDVFDMHYLSAYVDKERLLFCFDKYIFSKPKRENNIEDIVKKLEQIFGNNRYLTRLQSSKKNWEGLELSVVINELMDFFNTLKPGAKFKEEKEEKVDMCQALREMMEEANSEGRQEGAQDERTAMARRMLKEGIFSKELIARMTGMSLEEVRVLSER